MKHRFALAVVALCFALISTVDAQSGITPTPTLATPYRMCLVTTTSATTCLTSGGYLVAVQNMNSVAQAATLTCTDGTAASHTIAPATYGTGLFAWPEPGAPIAGVFVCTASAAPTGPGIAVYVRQR